MSRETYGLTNSQTPGSGQGTALQTWLSANLAQWSVGSLETLGSGVDERNWIRLTKGIVEILLYCPNGANPRAADGFYYLLGENVDQYPLVAAIAPNGFPSIGVGSDPDTLSWWSGLVASAGIQIGLWANTVALTQYWIEDNDRADLTIVTGKFVPDGYDSVVLGDLLLDSNDLSSELDTCGVFRAGYVAGATPQNSATYCSIAPASAGAPKEVSEAMDTYGNPLTEVTDSTHSATKFPAGSVPVWNSDPQYEFMGRIDDSLMLRFSNTDGSFKAMRNDGTDYWIHLHQELLTPWDSSLGAL